MMATKKELSIDEQREELINAIVEAEALVKSAKAAYKEFCIENPLQSKPQPTPHELRKMAEKLGKPTEADHAKANAAAAQSVAKAALVKQVKGE